jgi:hypothetical protein
VSSTFTTTQVRLVDARIVGGELLATVEVDGQPCGAICFSLTPEVIEIGYADCGRITFPVIGGWGGGPDTARDVTPRVRALPKPRPRGSRP